MGTVCEHIHRVVAKGRRHFHGERAGVFDDHAGIRPDAVYVETSVFSGARVRFLRHQLLHENLFTEKFDREPLIADVRITAPILLSIVYFVSKYVYIATPVRLQN